jgi:hypothetical protein
LFFLKGPFDLIFLIAQYWFAVLGYRSRISIYLLGFWHQKENGEIHKETLIALQLFAVSLSSTT